MLLFEPFAPLFELSRELDRLASGAHARSFVPAADVAMTDDEVTVVMDLPGLEPGDLDVELVDDVLTIRGERTMPDGDGQDGDRAWQRIERGFGRFERALHMPKDIDAERIAADMTDGVLTLRVPVVKTKPRRIQISAHDGRPELERELATA